MKELDKLQNWLALHGYHFRRIDDWNRHQIIVYANENCNENEVLWDAICHRGSYGYEEGLLEIMGDIVDEEVVGDFVEGWLTAEEVVDRIKRKEDEERSF